jgi:hypothetical protein
LRFELIDVFVGVDTVAVQYANEAGHRIVEVFTFENGMPINGAIRSPGIGSVAILGTCA